MDKSFKAQLKYEYITVKELPTGKAFCNRTMTKLSSFVYLAQKICKASVA